MDINIDEFTKIILVQEKWKYNWIDIGTWTYAERKDFHQKADSLIWTKWGSKLIIKTKGDSAFAKKHFSSGFILKFDIKWVISGEHWTVNVKKIALGDFNPSSVNWPNRTIDLDTEDTKKLLRDRGGKKFRQYPVAHEFGHAIGDHSWVPRMQSDEYPPGSINELDHRSMMNVGTNLRKRHINFILRHLKNMVPNTIFYAEII